MYRGKRLLAAVMLAVLILLPLAQASAGLNLKTFRRTYEPDPTFGFWENPKDGLYYARWERKNNGVSFSVRMQNDGCGLVDGFTLEISATDVYEEPVQLKAEDGIYEPTLWYTIEQDYKAGKNGYSKYIFVRGLTNIKHISATLVKYHSEAEGTVEIPESKQNKCSWTIK